MVALVAALVALVMLLAAVPAAAQVPATAAPNPPGPYVIDVRGAFIGAPKGAGFFPPVPSGTIAPSRAFVFDLGGHVYPFTWRAARIGLGANLLTLRGSASASETEEDAIPDIRVSVTTLAPQVSLNFGTDAGWSCLSFGLGRAQITGKRSAFDDGEEASRKSGGVSAVNAGGGARWFTSERLAVTFDVRFHVISAGKAHGTEAGTPRTTLVSVAAGMSFR